MKTIKIETEVHSPGRPNQKIVVVFRHYRGTHRLEAKAIREMEDVKNGIVFLPRAATVCHLTHGDYYGLEHDYHGTSFCSQSDIFDPWTGMRISLERALGATEFSSTERADIWDAVLERAKKKGLLKKQAGPDLLKIQRAATKLMLELRALKRSILTVSIVGWRKEAT